MCKKLIYLIVLVLGMTAGVTNADDYPLVDNMEYYADRSEIRVVWKDGYTCVIWEEDPPGNWVLVHGGCSGSFVNVNSTVTHDGSSRSMVYYYDNDGNTYPGPGNEYWKYDAPYYSEIEASTSGPNSLEIDQDWTAAKALSLWFYGDPDNDANATEQMYVKLNGSKVEYDGDMADIREASWHQWVIDLESFGVNLENVTNICIGFGDENNTTPGGSGVVFFDDITHPGPEAGSPDPEDGATDVPHEVVLSWTPGPFVGALSPKHKVFLSENFDDVNDGVGGVTQDPNRYPATGTLSLDFSKTYYWRVDEANSTTGWDEGGVWQFTTEPIAYPIAGDKITATASSSKAADQGPENTINGSGLDANDMHSTVETDMWLSGSHQPGEAWIEYEFDKVYKLHEMWVWNHNSPSEDDLGYGLKDVTIEYSENGADYTTLGGTTHEFAQAPGKANYEHNTEVPFGVAAKYVRLTANSNWSIPGFKSYGLSEVRFFRIPRAREDVRIAPVAVLADPATTSEVRTTLPDSITTVSRGSTYYVEIWASDVGGTNTGLTGVYVDVSFCSEMSAVAVEHGTIFTTFPSGTIQPDGVDEFGGSKLPSGGGIEPEWVRVGWLEMRADADVSACTISLLPSVTGVGAFDRGTISWAFVGLGSVTLHRDCNGNGIPDANDIALGTSGDCNGNGIPDECDIADGDSNDCNGNGVPDECDIADGTSGDCNGNGVPDECDIADGDSNDCNGNGIPDECDIADGTSTDVNIDGVPDECQFDVRIEPVVVLNDPNGMSEVRIMLPGSMPAVVRGSRYYVEIWASDMGDTNTGLTSVYVDLSFCGQTSATAVEHGTIFTTSPSGTIQPDGVDEFGGSALPSGGGIEPDWVRIGWITMIPDVDVETCTISLLPSLSGVEALDRGSIPWEFVNLGSVQLEILPPLRSYDLDSDGFISVGDLSLFAGSWLMDVPPGDETHDFNCDCCVGVGDLSWFATGWLKDPNDPTVIYPPCPEPNCAGGSMVAANKTTFESAIINASLVSVSTETLMVPPDVAFELVVLDAPSASDTTTALPASIHNITNGQTYYLEIWVSDVGYIDTGVTAAYVDLSFPDDAASLTNIFHGGIFIELETGSNDVPGEIDEVGGSTLSEGVGVEPQWARLAVVEMYADATPPSVTFALSPSSTGVSAWGRGTIPWDETSLGSVAIAVSDFDHDGDVDFDDLAELISYWLQEEASVDIAPYPTADGIVNLQDFALLAESWLAGTE